LKVSTFIYCHLRGNPDHERSTILSSVLTGSDWRSTVSCTPLPEQMDFGPGTLQSAAMPQPAALWPSPSNVLWQRLTILSSEYYQVLIATHLATPEGWKAELA